MSSARITYSQRPDATPKVELGALANVYRFVLDCHANRNAPSVTSSGGDDAKGRSKDDSSAKTRIP